MATYQAPQVTTYGYTPPQTGHGESQITTHLHTTAYVSAALATNDTIQFGYLPPNAVVAGVTLKADAQLDSNGTPTLAFDVGVTGTIALFKSAVTTVGHTSGPTADATIAPAGLLWKNTTGLKQLIFATVTTGAATGVAGVNVELDVSFWVEDTPGVLPI